MDRDNDEAIDRLTNTNTSILTFISLEMSSTPGYFVPSRLSARKTLMRDLKILTRTRMDSFPGMNTRMMSLTLVMAISTWKMT